MWVEQHSVIAIVFFLNVTCVTTSQRGYLWFEPSESGYREVPTSEIHLMEAKKLNPSMNPPAPRSPTMLCKTQVFASAPDLVNKIL